MLAYISDRQPTAALRLPWPMLFNRFAVGPIELCS
jgi:hypothetical protein